MLEPNETARLLSDLLKKIDEKKPEKETLAQVNSSFCLNKNKNKIVEFTQFLNAMRTKLSGLAERSFVAPLLGMTDVGNILRKSCHSEGNSPKNLCLEKGDPSLTLRMTDSGKISPKTNLVSQCPRALAPLKRRSFTSFRMTDGGEVAHTAQPKSVEKAVFAKSKKVAAFTLAEVLITLGVIGIVAAMTLPNLIANYKNLVLSTQLKKVVTTMDNGARMLLANEGVDYLKDTSLFIKLQYGYITNLDVFEKHFKLTPLPKSSKFVQDMEKLFGDFYHYDNKNDVARYYSSQEGACYYILSAYSSGDGFYGLFVVDINCDKGPNKWGYDRYSIQSDLSAVADFPKATTIFNDFYKAFTHGMENSELRQFLETLEEIKKVCKGNPSGDCEFALALYGLFFRYLDGWNIKW